MYEVTIRDKHSFEPVVIHSPYVEETKILSGSLNQGVNDISSFDFDISINNPGYSRIRAMRTIIDVVDTTTGRLEFRGRVLNYAETMDSNGVFSKSVVCESYLAFLHDSYNPYYDFTGTAEELFVKLINNHNLGMEEHKRFNIGIVDLNKHIKPDGTPSTPYERYPWFRTTTTAFVTPEKSTYENIKEHLLDVFGGEIQMRWVLDTMYLDYTASVRHNVDDPITIGKNLKSVTKRVDPSTIISRLVPLGKTITTESQTDNERRLTISSVNAGKDYIVEPNLTFEFGIQTGNIVWDNIEKPEELKALGEQWLADQKAILQQFTVEAIDLTKIGKSIQEFTLGNVHYLINPVMDINEQVRIIKKTIDVVIPINSSLTIGDKFKTLVDYQKEQRNAAKNVKSMQSMMVAQKNAVLSLNTQVSSVQKIIADTNMTELPAELQGLHLQLSNISDSIANLPSYSVATQTTDGLMSSTDKGKLDRLQDGATDNTIRKISAVIGDGVSTEYVVVHNLQTQNLIVAGRRTVAPYTQVSIDVDCVDWNTIRVLTMNPISATEKISITIIG